MSYRWMVKDQGRDGEGDLLGRRGGQRFRHDIPRFDLEDLDVSKNRGTPKSSIFIGFSIINHPFWGTLIFGNTHLPC